MSDPTHSRGAQFVAHDRMHAPTCNTHNDARQWSSKEANETIYTFFPSSSSCSSSFVFVCVHLAYATAAASIFWSNIKSFMLCTCLLLFFSSRPTSAAVPKHTMSLHIMCKRPVHPFIHPCECDNEGCEKADEIEKERLKTNTTQPNTAVIANKQSLTQRSAKLLLLLQPLSLSRLSLSAT